MNTFLDILYYALPVLATLWTAWKISPKFGNDFSHGRVNVLFVLVVMFIGGVMFILNSLIWATATFFVIRGAVA